MGPPPGAKRRPGFPHTPSERLRSRCEADFFQRLDDLVSLIGCQKVFVIHTEPRPQKGPQRLELLAFLVIGAGKGPPQGIDLFDLSRGGEPGPADRLHEIRPAGPGLHHKSALDEVIQHLCVSFAVQVLGRPHPGMRLQRVPVGLVVQAQLGLGDVQNGLFPVSDFQRGRGAEGPN